MNASPQTLNGMGNPEFAVMFVTLPRGGGRWLTTPFSD